MASRITTQEAVMGQAIPRQHPAVVLRSHYRQLRALLAIALVVVVGLVVGLMIVATDDESISTKATPVQSIEYGGFNPLTGSPDANVATPDESRIAAAISGTQQASDQSAPEGVDESSVASAIGNSSASPTGDSPLSQAQPGARP
jgi:hypothetical protein